MSGGVTIVEVAPRDGLQNEDVRLSVEQKRELVDRAAGYGARNIEVTSFVHPKKVPAMADAEQLCAVLPQAEGVAYSALILNERGLDRAIAAGVREVNVVVHCTDTFSRRNQGTDIAGGISIWYRIHARAADAGVRANLALAVAFGCPFEGEVPVDRLRRILGEALEAPPAELTLADTIGVAVPRDVTERFAVAREAAAAVGQSAEAPGRSDAGIGQGDAAAGQGDAAARQGDSARGGAPALRSHFHNTRNCGTANALAAIDAGVRIHDASLGGIGGCPFAPNATGNIATEDLVYALDRSGITHTLDEGRLAEAGAWLEHAMGKALPAMVLHAGGFPAGG